MKTITKKTRSVRSISCVARKKNPQRIKYLCLTKNSNSSAPIKREKTSSRNTIKRKKEKLRLNYSLPLLYTLFNVPMMPMPSVEITYIWCINTLSILRPKSTPWFNLWILWTLWWCRLCINSLVVMVQGINQCSNWKVWWWWNRCSNSVRLGRCLSRCVLCNSSIRRCHCRFSLWVLRCSIHSSNRMAILT